MTRGVPRVIRDDAGAHEVLADAQKAGVPAVVIGHSGGPSLVVKGLLSLKLADIKAAHEGWLPAYMNAAE